MRIQVELLWTSTEYIMAHQLTDQKVRRVLELLRDFRRKTLEEINESYNKKYPPPLIGKLIGMKITGRDTEPPLRFLVDILYVEKHIMSFTNETHDPPVIQYSLTNAGLQYLGSLK